MLSLSYIRPEIRHGEADPPPLDSPILPLRDQFCCQTSLTPFRHRVWHSLLVYEQQSLVYEYLDPYRMVEIHFENDPDYPALRPVQEVPLLVLIGGISEVPHSLLGPLFLQTLRIRAQRGQPTWVYMPSMDTVQRFYGTDAVNYVRAMPTLDGRPVVINGGSSSKLPTPPPDEPRKPRKYDPTAV